MAVWLIRAGSQGELEEKFLSENKVYVTWDALNSDVSKMSERKQLIEALQKNDPDAKPKKLINHASHQHN